MTEQAGIQVCEVGRIRGLEKILSSGLPTLYRRAYRLLGNVADAEDAVQEALLAAYTHLDQFKGQSQLRIQANSPFLLHWTSDDWQYSTDMRSKGTAIGIEFVDIPLPKKQKTPIQFTFLWLDEDRWEGKDYKVNVRELEATGYRSVDYRRRKKAQGKRAATVG